MIETTQQKSGGGILKGAAWIGSSRLVVRLLGLCSTLVLARLLVPEDFGLVAVATSVVGLLEAFSEMGFNQALIRFQDADDHDYSTAWTLNLCRGLLLSVILLALAYPLSLSLDDERLFYVFLVIAALPVFRGLENPRLVIFEKKMQFDVTFRVMVITKLAGVITTIALAFLWRTYWVLITGMIVTAVTRSLLSYLYAPGRVSVTIRSWRKLFGFSGWLTGAGVLGSIGNKLDPMILMAYSSPQVVGILHLANELSYMLFNEVAAPLRRVLFPEFSRLDPSSQEFIDTYKNNISGLFLVLSPVSAGFALTAPLFVPLILGEKWTEAIIPIQLLSSAMVISIVGRISQSVVMAVGKTRLIFMRFLFVTPIKLALVFIGVYLYGLHGAVWAITLEIIITTIVNVGLVKKILNIGLFRHLFFIRQSIIPLLGMCLVVFFTMHMPRSDGAYLSLLVRFVSVVLSGVLTYSFLHYILWRFSGSPNGTVKVIISFFKKK